jgi:hypothetical protein
MKRLWLKILELHQGWLESLHQLIRMKELGAQHQLVSAGLQDSPGVQRPELLAVAEIHVHLLGVWHLCHRGGWVEESNLTSKTCTRCGPVWLDWWLEGNRGA